MFSEQCLVQAPQGAKDWVAVAGGSGPGGLPAGGEGPVAQSSPFSTSAQPCLRAPKQLPAPECIRKATGEENARGPG